MANHVSNCVRVHNISEEGQKVWDSIIERIEELGDFKHLTGLFYEADEDGYWIVPEGEEAGDKVGAKWAFPQDWDDEFISIESAWGPVIPLVEYIATEIGKVDESVQLILTYEDEGPNFVGVATFNDEGLDCDNDIDYDNIRELVVNEVSELREMWDEDEGCWIEDKEEEADDLFSDVLWDFVNDWQSAHEEWTDR